MEFVDILEQTTALLQHQGRISYGALKRRFGLDDACLDDLKIELIEAQQLARDENGRILVWVGQPAPTLPSALESALSPASTVPRGAFPHGERHLVRAGLGMVAAVQALNTQFAQRPGEVCLAIMQAATTHRDITMQHQVAVPDGV